jgi:C-terminal processing protease CtpA/Prc
LRYSWFGACLSLAFTFLLSSCSSVPGSSKHAGVLRDEENLKKDVDYTYHKLEKFHAKLNWYISERELELKMDSVKRSITAPMTSQEFFMKFSPVIASLKQGHTQLIPLISTATYKELTALGTGTGSPLAYFDFEIFDDNLYITRNKNNYPEVPIGSEVITMNGIEPQELIAEYGKTFASDGYNTTYANHRLSQEFSSYFILRTGKADSILCQLKYHDSIRTVCLTAVMDTTTSSTDKQVKKQEQEKQKYTHAKEGGPPKWSNGNIHFEDADSAVAVLKIESFFGKNYNSYLKYWFQKLNQLGTQYLILDLRDNPGGSAEGAAKLYSYLLPQPGPFIDDIEVKRRSSLMHTPYYVAQPFWSKIVLTVFLPIRIIGLTANYLVVKKREDGTFYFRTNLSKSPPPNPIQFSGSVYVLINGGTFSAASLLSSNLQGAHRAVFVGEETGGAYNGTVAGSFAFYQLPASKLKILFGLALIQPHYKSDIEGRGIFPDIEITPTIDDRVNGIDPELQWILDHIHSAAGK